MNSFYSPPTFTILTLGCKVNQYESDRMKEQLAGCGFLPVKPGDSPSICIVNTCTVTGEAARKSRQAIRRLMSLSPGCRIYAMGCAAEIPGDALGNLPENVSMIKNIEKDSLAQKIAGEWGKSGINGSVSSAPATGNRVRAYLKIQDGCDNHCTYCIIPKVRGQSRSREPLEILEEIKRLEKAGYQEVVITGIHLGDYGRGIEKPLKLWQLVDFLMENTSIPRVRLSSLEPMDFSFELLKVYKKHPRLCRHLHLPMQHAANSVLKRMGRGYAREDYDNIIKTAFSELPGLNVTTDLMVGFPGETEEDFQVMYDYVKETPFFMLHVFPFSLHRAVPAARLGGFISGAVKKDRLKKLLTLGKEKTGLVLEKYVGGRYPVLAEQSKNNRRVWGHTENYAKVEFDGGEDLRGKIVSVTIVKKHGEILYGENPEPVCSGG